MKKLYHCLYRGQFTYDHLVRAVVIAENKKEVCVVLEEYEENPKDFEIYLICQTYIDDYGSQILCGNWDEEC